MYPVLVQIGGFRLHGYGVALLVAVLAAIWVANREAQRRGLGPSLVGDLATPVVLAGIAGGRLAHVIGWEPELFWRDPLGVLAVWRGGLAVHGAIIGGLLAALWFCRRRRLDFWGLADVLAPGVALGQGLGRLGCFLSGDGYGRPTDLPWAVTFTNPESLAPLGVPLHPAQLYEFALDILLFAALWAVRKRTIFDGQLFLLYLGGYGAVRLVTEVFRGDRIELGLGLSLLQGASLVLMGAALLGLAWRLTPRRGVS